MKNIKVALIVGAVVGVAYGAYNVLRNSQTEENLAPEYNSAEVYDPHDFDAGEET